jgi:4-diphosphocytidyl-2-C-methyl-D-erythritol kinase
MIVFPNAKINIGLNVIEKRHDGFHNIESCFYPVPWYDALEVIESEKFIFNATGQDIPGNSNICIDAYQLLKKDYNIPAISIHIHKNIPIGAGLGGGSADGAFMLKLLNEKFSLGLNTSQLQGFAGQLGSDCPFFIENTPRYVEGTGDKFSSININLKGLFIAVIYPQIHVDTPSAYKGIVPAKPARKLKKIIGATAIESWRDQLTNDFEMGTDDKILQLKKSLYDEGALYASMTGSGSAVYGLFRSAPEIESEYPNIISQL